MQPLPARPVFVVGSPRSGTSILTWCLGHHPNLFPVPESNWMGDFAVNVAIAHQIGTARGEYSTLSAMEIRDDELFAALGQSINDLILQHRTHLEQTRETMSAALKLNPRWVEAASTAAGPKTRWVDGTPEYSLHICGLRKLFPGALFIHLVRDVDSVVRSLLNFNRVSGTCLVTSEEEAYKYWLRRVETCLKAEQAYGPAVVHRLLYSSLIEKPQSAIRSLLDFIGEPYSAKCLEPLAERINSSNVPDDFVADDPATDPAVVEEATRLSRDLEETAQPAEASRTAADEMETGFAQWTHYMATLDGQYRRALQIIQKLERTQASENTTL
jgi:Sulfotransferase family